MRLRIMKKNRLVILNSKMIAILFADPTTITKLVAMALRPLQSNKTRIETQIPSCGSLQAVFGSTSHGLDGIHVSAHQPGADSPEAVAILVRQSLELCACLARREALDLTQDELADPIDCPAVTIRKIESFAAEFSVGLLLFPPSLGGES